MFARSVLDDAIHFGDPFGELVQRGLEALASAAGKSWVRGVVLYAGTEIIPFASNLHGVPFGRLWSG
jgi:hypothetical protein